jgi:hypothetical protein
MMTFAIALLAGWICPNALGSGNALTTAAGLAKRGGPPAFTAVSVNVRHHRLLASGLDAVDADADARRLTGCVWIYCDAWDVLRLWVAKTDWEMKRATPLLGHEGPGKALAKAAAEGAKAARDPIPLGVPVRLVLVFVDGRGAIARIRVVQIAQLQLAEVGPVGL